MSKENKRFLIVQMGLIIDSNGIAIEYKLFPGNTPDISILITFVTEMKEKYKFGDASKLKASNSYGVKKHLKIQSIDKKTALLIKKHFINK